MSLGDRGRLRGMIRYGASISLDGFAAGPNQGPENPLGVGGTQLHGWMRELAVWRERAGVGEGGAENASATVLEAAGANLGA